jgi:hypothetical protein
LNAACFDISGACSGYLYALEIAEQFISTHVYNTVLIIGADWAKDRYAFFICAQSGFLAALVFGLAFDSPFHAANLSMALLSRAHDYAK